MLGEGRCYVAVNTRMQYPSFLVHRYKPDGEGGCVSLFTFVCLY